MVLTFLNIEVLVIPLLNERYPPPVRQIDGCVGRGRIHRDQPIGDAMQ